MRNYKTSLKDSLIVFFAKVAAILISFIIALIPTLLYMSLKFMLSPHGFWQNILLLGVSFYFLGAIQVICLVLWIFVLIAIIVN